MAARVPESFVCLSVCLSVCPEVTLQQQHSSSDASADRQSAASVSCGSTALLSEV